MKFQAEKTVSAKALRREHVRNVLGTQRKPEGLTE